MAEYNYSETTCATKQTLYVTCKANDKQINMEKTHILWSYTLTGSDHHLVFCARTPIASFKLGVLVAHLHNTSAKAVQHCSNVNLILCCFLNECLSLVPLFFLAISPKRVLPSDILNKKKLKVLKECRIRNLRQTRLNWFPAICSLCSSPLGFFLNAWIPNNLQQRQADPRHNRYRHNRNTATFKSTSIVIDGAKVNSSSCWFLSNQLLLLFSGAPPANMRRWPDVGELLAHRLRCQLNRKPTLGQHILFAGHCCNIFAGSYVFELKPECL